MACSLLVSRLVVDYIICKTDKKLTSSEVKLSRDQVYEWLAQHPKSPWWISNSCVVDYCRIPHDTKKHSTSILDKFLPHKTTVCEKSQGMEQYFVCNNVLNILFLTNIGCLFVFDYLPDRVL